jgi:anti-sigma regulatory factor (Ser/Thr protein kinase)
MEAVLNNVPSAHQAFAIADASGVAYARRAAAEAARAVGLSETDTGRVALVVTEAATNILKHAGQGEILVRRVCVAEPDRFASYAGASGIAGIEIFALDSGPGIHDLNAAFADGQSSTGTSGTGLGAIQRLSDELSVYSQPGLGTVIRALVQTGGQDTTRSATIDIGMIGVCYPGEDVSGDAWAVNTDAQGLTLLVVDGLGHGVDAHRAAVGAAAILHANPGRPPGELIERMHEALRPTRGAAAAVARIDLAAASLTFAGIGNISGCVIGEQDAGFDPAGRTRSYADSPSRQLVSHNGIVGHAIRKVQEFTVAWPRGGMLVMHSDGIGTRWDLARYPGLSHRPAALIAATLYRDFTRRHDDATVVVVKANHV